MSINNENNYLRIRFNKKELMGWGLENPDTDSLKGLIKKGLSNKGPSIDSPHLIERIDLLENKIDRLALMLGQYCHHNFIANGDKLHEIIKDFECNKDFNSTERLRVTGEYLRLSLSIRDQYFPELKIPSFLLDSKTKIKALDEFFEKFHPNKNNENIGNNDEDGNIISEKMEHIANKYNVNK